MKKKLVFLTSIIAIFFLLAVSAFAMTEARNENDIIEAISSSSTGDTVNIKLMEDITLSTTVEISKSITLNLYFNGYTLDYQGYSGDSFSYAGLKINHALSTLNLYGSNKLLSYSEYTHYSDDVKPDMTGSGNLIVILLGSLNVYDSYLLSSENSYAIVGDMIDNNDYAISIYDSVLRAPEGSSRSAMVHEGGNSSNNSIIKRTLNMKNSVLYGGFKGINYAYNLTTGTGFENVKFYDFYIKNDCWYSPDISTILPLLMNSFEKSAEYRSCLFRNYDETIGDITIYTETGKQNFKLINCSFNEIKSGGKFNGDRGGDAYVYVIENMPTCTESGSMLVCKNGGSLTSATIPQGEHVFDNGTLTYQNGYAKNGLYIYTCTLCAATKNGEEENPIFLDLGFSINDEQTDVAKGTHINKELLERFLNDNEDINIDFGVLAGNSTSSVSLVDGKVTIDGGVLASFTNHQFSFISIKLVNIAKELSSTNFALEFYISDGKTIEYSDGAYDYVSVDYLNIALDEIRNQALKLLETKHKLYYNDDGSFRVLIIADAHMNVDGNATDVQEVKDRIKNMVDKTDPNLVIFTGDNVINSNSEEKLRRNIDAIVSYIEEKEIPWCHVYGNHDHEGSLSNAEQQKVYETYEWCVSKAGDIEISGTGNYVLGVYNKDGTLGSAIYCLDSGAYANGGYDYIKDDQIEWYKQSSLLLEEYTGKKIPAIMAFHIPLIENTTAYNNRDNKEIVYSYTGNRNESICSSATDTNLLETIFERGDVKAIVTGHDHVNDYMFNYMGVKLSSSPNISDLTYYTASIQGSRVFDLNLDTIDDVPTYVEYVIERINPDKYGTYENDKLLVDGDENLTLTPSGYDGSGITGSATITVTENGGYNNSQAIQVIRSQSNNFEIYIQLENSSYGKIGDNKYLIIWVDFTNVEFRKACFGLITNDGTANPYRTDDHDTTTPFYYLADGSSEWVALSHGADGCFGDGDRGSQAMKGTKGYLALPVEYFKEGSRLLSADSLITGIYMYADVNSGHNTPFYLDNIMLVADYKAVELPNE